MRRSWPLFLWLLVIAASLITAADLRQLRTYVAERWFPTPESRALLAALRAVETAPDDATALRIADSVIGTAAGDSGIAADWQARLWLAKAEAHWRLWHAIDAQDAWRRAVPLVPPPRRRDLQDRIAMSERMIEDWDAERTVETDYLAAPRAGPAGALVGSVLVIYLFVEDAGPGRWGPRTRGRSLHALLAAERWLAAAAAAYGSRLTFSHRVFLIDRDPVIGRERVAATPEGYRVGRAMAERAARHLGAPHVLALVEEMRALAGTEHALLILHLNRDERSFATRCLRACGETAEYAFVLASPDMGAWERTPHVQAHEMLHVFGADDLYNIATAQRYAPRDIMHHPSRLLHASTLEPLTAYAVGLGPRPADPPFPVRTVH